MAKKKKARSANLLGVLITLVFAAAAVVALFLPWFTRTLESGIIDSSSTKTYGLFVEGFSELDFPLTIVTIFGCAAAAFAVISLIAYIGNEVGVFKIKMLLKFLLAVITVILGALALIFIFVFVGNFGGLDGGDFLRYTWQVGIGAYIGGIGTILTGIMLMVQGK